MRQLLMLPLKAFSIPPMKNDLPVFDRDLQAAECSTSDPCMYVSYRRGYDKAGRDQYGFDATGFDRFGFDKDGFDKAGYGELQQVRHSQLPRPAVDPAEAVQLVLQSQT